MESTLEETARESEKVEGGVARETGKATSTELHSRSVAFVAIMAALGTILSWVSTMSLPIGPGISVDLSHIGTYIVAIGGGPILGLATGSIVGLIPSFQYANPAVIPGKMMTGITVGIIYFALKRIPQIRDNEKLKLLAIPIAGIVGYVPEYIFTIWDLKYIVGMPDVAIATILSKAWVEIVVISVITTILFGVPAIQDGIKKLIGEDNKLGRLDYVVTGIVIAASIVLLTSIFINTGFGWNPASTLVEVFWGWLVAIAVVLVVLVVALVVQIKRGKV
ncbi:MAG: hypothetical protein ACTSU5_16555 [Promethearchaeota archaeon]